MKANFDDAVEYEFTLVPAGSYACKVVDATEKTAQTGNDFIEVVMEIMEGPESGSYLRDRLFATKKAINRLKRTIHRLTGMKLQGNDVEVDPKTLMGCKAWVDVEIEEREGIGQYSGKTFRDSRVAWDGYKVYTNGDGEPATTEVPKKDDDDIPDFP